MHKHRFVEFAILIVTLGVSLTVSAQERSDPAALIAAQHQAMASLAVMDGVWRGPARTILPSGQKHTITDVLSLGKNAFLLTDDNAGVVYYIYEE